MEKKTYIALLSGGRDSSAMVEVILKNKMPLDYIVFTDTGHEFSLMYEYLDKFDDYLKRTYNKQITYLYPKDDFEKWVFGKVTRGGREGYIRGVPMVTIPCFWTREAKIKSVEMFVKEKDIKKPIYYVGYTYSERKRAKVKANNQIYPLIDLKLCEADVDKILKDIDLENPLYKYFSRTGCYFCPKQTDRAFFVLWKHFKKEWEYMKVIEQKLQGYKNVINNKWHRKHTLSELEQIFQYNNKSLSDTPPASCECKVNIQPTLFDFNNVNKI